MIVYHMHFTFIVSFKFFLRIYKACTVSTPSLQVRQREAKQRVQQVVKLVS